MSDGRVGWVLLATAVACGSPPNPAGPALGSKKPVAPRAVPVMQAALPATKGVTSCARISVVDLAAGGSPFAGVVALDAAPAWAALAGSQELLSPDPFDSPASDELSLAFVLPGGAAKVLRWGPETDLGHVLADGVILVSKDGCVQRVDLPSGQVRWTAQMAAARGSEYSDYLSKDTLAYRNGSDLGVLDLKSGAKFQDASIARWLTSGTIVADNGHAALLQGPNSLAVVDMQSDRRLWNVDRGTSGGDATLAVALGTTNLVLLQGRTPQRQEEHACIGGLLFNPSFADDPGDPAWCQSRLVSLTTDGHVVKELAWTATRLGRGDAALTVDGDEVYVSMPERVGRADGRHVEALALPNLTPRWRTPAVPCGEAGLEISPDSVTRIQVTKTSVFVCGCDGVLRRFARDSGKETGSFGVGTCHASTGVSDDAALVPMTKGTAATGEVSWNPWSSWCPDDQKCTHHLLALGAQAFTAPLIPQTVTGKVDAPGYACDLISPAFTVQGPFTVRVGERLIQTSASGAFNTVVSQRGILSVDIMSPERWEEQCGLFADRPVTVTIDGKVHASLAPGLRQFAEYVLGGGP